MILILALAVDILWREFHHLVSSYPRGIGLCEHGLCFSGGSLNNVRPSDRQNLIHLLPLRFVDVDLFPFPAQYVLL